MRTKKEQSWSFEDKVLAMVFAGVVLFVVLMFGITLKGQEVETTPPTAQVEEVNEITIPELNLLKIQNLNLRFQLLVVQRTQIERELQNIQAQVVAEVENLRDSLETDKGNWNVDLQRGVFVRIPKPIEEKKE